MVIGGKGVKLSGFSFITYFPRYLANTEKIYYRFCTQGYQVSGRASVNIYMMGSETEKTSANGESNRDRVYK